ncbi:MAG: hypothetical protein ACREBU_05285 [Nitrososphaera sp.]
MEHDKTAIHTHNQAGEIVCRTHQCPICDVDYKSGGTDDGICGMNLGFPHAIPREISMKAYIKAASNEVKIGEVLQEFTVQQRCSECQCIHLCKLKLIYEGIQGTPNKDHSFRVVCN